MTEQEWLQDTDPDPMLEFLQGSKASERKLQLFACACCRTMWDSLDKQTQEGIELVEKYVGTRLSVGVNIIRAGDFVSRADAKLGVISTSQYQQPGQAIVQANHISKLTAWRHPEEYPRSAYVFQASALRCIFGNPFMPISLDPSWPTWHDGLLVSMAQRMYDSRDFSDMPVLADGLEEAGCQDQNILSHCRSGGEHVRGCWVVDLVLGKK